MKNLYFILFILFTVNSYSQETFYKNYKIRNFIDFLNDGKNTYDYDNLTKDEKSKVKFLSKEKCVSYNSLSTTEKVKINARIKLVRDGILTEIKFKDCSGNEFIVNKSNADISKTKELIGVNMTVRAKTFGSDKNNNTVYKAGLLMDKGKLYVNLWPFKDKPGAGVTSDDQDDDGVSKFVSTDVSGNKKNYKPDNKLEFTEHKSENDNKETRKELFYEIPDDHTAVFNFTEINVNAITIPLKYRFRTDRNALMTNDSNETVQINIESEEFSTSFNIALFGGYSWGKTKFTHRKKIGNKEKTNKNTIGAFIGSDAITLSSTNTDVIINQPQGDREGTIGTISFGVGFVKSWNKISFGIFSGIDKGVGRVSETWIYDGKPWLGIGLGYDLFKL